MLIYIYIYIIQVLYLFEGKLLYVSILIYTKILPHTCKYQTILSWEVGMRKFNHEHNRISSMANALVYVLPL